MPVIVQRRRRLLLFVCGKHSVPSRTPFRQATKTVRLATGMAFTFTTEYCSDSQRNGVRLQTGIAFTFDRIPQLSQMKFFVVGMILTNQILTLSSR